MIDSGLFITLFDKDTLCLYLDRGVYGFHMPPTEDKVSVYSKHYAALADYACARNGTHVFFFLKREVVYGGQVKGSSQYGAFYLNGPYSALGRRAGSEVVWDESQRSIYKASARKGVFTRPRAQNPTKEYCQPYLLLFEDRIGLKGSAIVSDQLYFELGEFPYPLPTNSIQGMGMCTMTPGEVDRAMRLLRNSPKPESYTTGSDEKVDFQGDPVPFSPEHGIQNLREAESEQELEAAAIADPTLLAEMLQPKGASICRQVPISPFKPFQMDRADVCYFSEEAIEEGTIPNTVLELKNKQGDRQAREQMLRYAKWLTKRIGSKAARIAFYVVAPSFTRDWSVDIPVEYQHQILPATF